LGRQKLHVFPHHLCHAASAYMMMPAGSRAGVLVYDGFGSIIDRSVEGLRQTRETFSFYVFHKDGYEKIGGTTGVALLEPDDFPTAVTNSIGMLYELVTGCLGFAPMDGGKTMGLSSYGQPRYLDILEKFVSYGSDMSNCFQCTTDQSDLTKAIDGILTAGRGGFEVKADLAASVQALLNKTLLRCADFFGNRSIDNLCVSGGCGLNTVANSELASRSPLPVFVPPHCGDAGLALGALWLELHGRAGVAPAVTFCGHAANPSLARPGRLYSDDERRRAVQQFYPRVVLDPSVSSGRELARVIARGAIVGVLNGRSEIGPRALGGRSILGDPRSVATRERINRLLKRREPFRPLAPIVLRSQYDAYFSDNRFIDPFMLKNARVRERCRLEAPAIVHVDATARVQVVDDDGDPLLVQVLTEFHHETGVGVLINTSFNRRGEPIVETPLDALDAFLGMGLDGLFVDGEFYRPAPSERPSV
jgi:carbamoyltransferase